MKAERCIDHLNFTGQICPDCGLEVDSYGNTEDQFDYCSFPDCGCDGARLCMADEASPRACEENVEGMWLGRKPEHRAARKRFIESVMREQAGRAALRAEDGGDGE